MSDITVQHTGSDTFYSKDGGEFYEQEVVRVLCDDMDDCRAVGSVVSLLHEYEDADRIRELVDAGIEFEARGSDVL